MAVSTQFNNCTARFRLGPSWSFRSNLLCHGGLIADGMDCIGSLSAKKHRFIAFHYMYIIYMYIHVYIYTFCTLCHIEYCNVWQCFGLYNIHIYTQYYTHLQPNNLTRNSRPSSQKEFLLTILRNQQVKRLN